SRFLHRNIQTQAICRLEVTVGGVSAETPALLDTGNSLCDTITGVPVLIVDYERVEKLIPKALRPAFKRGTIDDAESIARAGWAGRIRMIPYGSLNGTGGLLPAFRPDNVKAESGGRKISTANALVDVSVRPLSRDGSYGALLSPHLFSEVRV
ncbi:MAG: sigma-E processing peptidase SpoIIGA, partial [Clostridia bacterium]|nr:sigma-E processing peptidase SpoIIGA [Clostridia bacterium]